jgi:hypothetical protein
VNGPRLNVSHRKRPVGANLRRSRRFAIPVIRVEDDRRDRHDVAVSIQNAAGDGSTTQGRMVGRQQLIERPHLDLHLPPYGPLITRCPLR